MSEATWATEEELFKLATIVQHDALPQHLEAAYLFGNTPDLEGSILDKAAEMERGEKADRLCLCGIGATAGPQDPGHHIAYRGDDAWKNELQSRGVAGEKIVSIPQGDKIVHTGTEATHFVEWCVKQGHAEVAIVVHPIHALRAFTSVVSAIKRMNIDLRACVVVSDDARWQERALYSQHGEYETKIDMLAGELERLNQWYEKGDLAEASSVLTYLLKRGF